MFWVVVTLVFLNTCVLATEHHNQPEWLGNFQALLPASTSIFFSYISVTKLVKKGVRKN
jgi:voltage-dependent calcium channel L type alpha-1D